MQLVELGIDQHSALLIPGPVLAHPMIVVGMPGKIPAKPQRTRTGTP